VLLLFSEALLEETRPREVAGEVPDAEVDFPPEFHFPQAMLRNHSADSALSLAGGPETTGIWGLHPQWCTARGIWHT